MEATNGGQLNAVVVRFRQSGDDVIHQLIRLDDPLADVLVVGAQRSVRLNI